MPKLRITKTDLEGLYQIHLAVFPDTRGSFREVYQAEKLEALGLPHLGPVQWNISENTRKGILRGIHAEPWDKYIHCIAGRAFAAVVDLRPESPTFKQIRTFEMNPENALFVAKGFGNAYQALDDHTIYGYLVNAHWQAGQKYLQVRYDDPELHIQWPLPVGPDDVSEKDRGLPTVQEVFLNS